MAGAVMELAFQLAPVDGSRLGDAPGLLFDVPAIVLLGVVIARDKFDIR